MRPRLLAALATLAILAIAATLVTLSGRGDETADRSTVAAAEHPVTVPELPRTVLVSAWMPMLSADERRLSAMLEEGELPKRPVMADVITDTDCAPDEQMISLLSFVVEPLEALLGQPPDFVRCEGRPCVYHGERAPSRG